MINLNHFIITKVWFPIQLTIVTTIHHTQGLLLDELAFDPTNIKKHGLTYTSFSHTWTKENLFLLTPLKHENFYVDSSIHTYKNE